MRKDFALCFNDVYVPYASVTIKSIVDNMNDSDEVFIHIFSDYLSISHQKFIKKILSNAYCKCKCIYYIVGKKDESFFDNVPVLTWSIYAWYRLLLPKYVGEEVEKILYLDCDVLVNDNLDYLFSIDIEKFSIAACLDIQAYNPFHYKRLNYESSLRYICSGVLLMNLDKWRKEDLAVKVKNFAIENACNLLWPDQDSINYICRDSKIILSPKYGVLVPFFRSENFIKEHLEQMNILIEHPAIIHYAGYQPWIYPKNKSMHAFLWWKKYNSLHAFPQVRIFNVWFFLKYWIKVLLIKLRAIRSGSRMYVFDMYYNHPRIKKEDVYNLMKNIY